MANESSVWYRIGYALERASAPHPPVADPVARAKPVHVRRDLKRPGPDPLVRGALSLAGALVGGRAPDRLSLATGAAAGAAAEVVRGLLAGALGTGRTRVNAQDLGWAAVDGMIYSVLVRPWVPGPVWLRGGAFGVGRVLSAGSGGLSEWAGPLSPHRKIPMTATLLGNREATADSVADHVIFSLALAVLYESSPSSNGIAPDA